MFRKYLLLAAFVATNAIGANSMFYPDRLANDFDVEEMIQKSTKDNGHFPVWFEPIKKEDESFFISRAACALSIKRQPYTWDELCLGMSQDPEHRRIQLIICNLIGREMSLAREMHALESTRPELFNTSRADLWKYWVEDLKKDNSYACHVFGQLYSCSDLHDEMLPFTQNTDGDEFATLDIPFEHVSYPIFGFGID
ncbi:MAG: hypothetical protein LBJ89_03645, partial [Holosporales bacterium]|nr:hypothetical protein [Holosporales bacterium]